MQILHGPAWHSERLIPVSNTPISKVTFMMQHNNKELEAKPALTLHHCVSARSFRPLWLLEEVGAPYVLAMHAFPPRAHSPQYLDVNHSARFHCWLKAIFA